MLQHVAACCSMCTRNEEGLAFGMQAHQRHNYVSHSALQCVAVCCGVLQCVAVCCSVLQCVAVCCSVVQSVAVCCSVSQCINLK